MTATNTTIGYIVFHYPTQGRTSDLTHRVETAVAALRSTSGCITADSWVTPDDDAVVATGRWQSEEALEASFATCREQGVDFHFDERERQPRRTFKLRPTTHSDCP
ncbi:antibiotic biosynthesis monooxygenase [Rhodococcus sp. IEGM 1379]|uniref:antibiotic biosynthesis monooxygenase n=1 Tax=Rhodococcus sp. IEGM 1379 TaxID=3047086 RepID=UPI0024B7EF25|nr:antibiotic biosynthesis monooxygenase [Rhodococcus sp. IEGM 1379]MDI9915454.1 antibiotic biosynthesis monooxygenase [Rhodococcus sp. IEGM 1379]